MLLDLFLIFLVHVKDSISITLCAVIVCGHVGKSK